MARPGIRTLNRGNNAVSRPTSPANYRGPAVREISPALATQQTRSDVLATGRRNQTAPQASPATAAAAAGTVFTQQISKAMQATQKGFQDLLSQLPMQLPMINTPVAEIPGINKPIAEISGINKPVISNPVQAAGAFIQTSQYSPEMVQEAKVRARQGDVVSGLYAATADTIVKGTDDLYQRVQRPGYNPTSQSLAGVLKAAGGLVSSVPAALQAVNFMNNPQKQAYTGQLPQKISGVSLVNDRPAISDTMTVSVDSVEQANTVLGELTTSAGKLAQQELPKVVDYVATEFRENPYGLAGQILGGAVLAKGIGRTITPKKPSTLKIEGEKVKSKTSSANDRKQTRPTKEEATPWVNADYTIKASRFGGSPSARSGGPMPFREVVSRNAVNFADLTQMQKQAALTTGAGGTAAYLAGSAEVVDIRDVPRQVMTISFSNANSLVDEILEDYPTKDRPSTAEDSNNRNSGRTSGGVQYGGGTLVINPVKDANITRIEGSTIFRPEFRVVDMVKVSELLRDESGTSNRTRDKYVQEYAPRTRTGEESRYEFAYDVPAVSSPRTKRGKKRIDIDIDIPRKEAKPKVKRKKPRYGKRQIINPIPWLWDEEPEFTAEIPRKVETVSAEEILS